MVSNLNFYNIRIGKIGSSSLNGFINVNKPGKIAKIIDGAKVQLLS